MATPPLKALEQLRATRVEAAQLALSQARREQVAAEELVQEAARALAELSLPEAFQAAESVRDYLWLERKTAARRLLEHKAQARHIKAQLIQAQALAAVQAAQAKLREAELDRRAAATLLSREEAVRARAAELRQEEDAEDIHRSRRG